jgi:hypothetical protein
LAPALGQIIEQGTHIAANHPTSRKRHNDNQADDDPGGTDPPSLTVT